MRESSMESSAMRTRDDTVTSSLASVILHACSEFCVRFWDCPLVRYDNANMIPRMVIRYHPSLTGYNIPHAICWYNRICCVQLKVLIFEGSSHTWTYSYSNDKWSVIVELSLQTRPNTCKHYAVDTRRSFTRNQIYLQSIEFKVFLQDYEWWWSSS